MQGCSSVCLLSHWLQPISILAFRCAGAEAANPRSVKRIQRWRGLRVRAHAFKRLLTSYYYSSR